MVLMGKIVRVICCCDVVSLHHHVSVSSLNSGCHGNSGGGEVGARSEVLCAGVYACPEVEETI